jgi:hypothetical protein
MGRSSLTLMSAALVGVLVGAQGEGWAEPPPERRAVMMREGTEEVIEVGEARQRGLTVVDLSDEWVPYIFREVQVVNPEGEKIWLANRYKRVYSGLANDLSDGDGVPLSPGEKNYLELYGIPPSFGVLRQRFLADKGPEACAGVDYELLRSAATVPLKGSPGRPPPELAKVFAEVEKRLACEGLMGEPAGKKKGPRHTKGRFDEVMRTALIRFQRKHMLYDAAALKRDTMATLARPPLENDYAAFLRVLTERVVAAANVLEDGSLEGKNGPPSWEDSAGQKVPLRNLVKEAVDATVEQLGLGTPEAALAFLERHPVEHWRWLKAAVKLPPVPEYYGPDMDLSVEIDRGDVFYDPPWDENGKAVNQSRKRFPHLVLRVRHNGKLIPLIRWRTTIGGWRSDLAPNGYEYFRYKGSDVGPRVWRHVVSGPVWIAPNSTPIRSLVKPKTVNGRWERVVNYDEIGPGYLSAYGLVAAYNVVPGKDGRPDWDNGVRVHGSSEILSIRNPEAYSHGCHRLMNHLAVRLFSFVLRHRPVVIEGDQPLNFSRQFLFRDDVYELRLPTRGFRYRLEPPLPVNVLEGNILSKLKKPMVTYIAKPGVKYPPGPVPLPPDVPEARAGGGGGGE